MRTMRGTEAQTYVRLGAAIREARERKGWTLGDFRCAMKDRDTKNVQEIELGKTRCTVFRLLSIARALEVDPAELVKTVEARP